MIHSGSIQKCAPYLRILTDDQIQEIRRAAFDVMFSAGFKVLHDGARKMLKQAGAIINGEIVKVPEFIVNDCLSKTPKGFTVYNRQGQRAMEVEGRKSYYGTNPASPNTKDARTGEIHPTTVADIVKETVYTKNIEAAIEAEAIRNELYSDQIPDAKWIGVSRLLYPELLVEIGIVAKLP